MLYLNELDILSCRKVKNEAPHFSKVMVSKTEWVDDGIEDWISNNLKGRFYILSQPYLNDEGKLKTAKFAGFEDHKEITYFILACPYLRRN